MAAWTGKGLVRLASVGATIAVVVFVVRTLDWPKVVASLADLSPRAVFLCLLAALLSQGLAAVRWGVIAGRAIAPSVEDVLIAAHANLFNLITPAALGGDVYRVMARAPDRGRLRSAGLVLLDRILGIWAYAAIFLVAALVVDGWLSKPFQHLPAPFTVALVVLGPLAISGPIAAAAWPLSRNLRTALCTRVPAARSVLTVERQRGALAIAAGAAISLASVFAWVLAASIMVAQFDPVLNLSHVALVAVLTEFARLIPISPQGIGVREVAFASLASLFGSSRESALVACTLLYVVNYGAVILLGGAAGVARAFTGRRRERDRGRTSTRPNLGAGDNPSKPL